MLTARLERGASDQLRTRGSRCLLNSYIFPSVDITIPGSKSLRNSNRKRFKQQTGNLLRTYHHLFHLKKV